MLSSKNSRKHGMRNEKWSTRDKNQQLRALLKLHGRDKKLQADNGAKFKKKLTKTIKELKGDIVEYRSIVKDTIWGDKRIIRQYLQTEKDFKKFLKDADPEVAYNVVFQDYNKQRKQLDKLMYYKTKQEKKICTLKDEYAVLVKILHVPTVLPREIVQQRRQQELISGYQVALAKHHAAQSIADSYSSLLDILKRDSKYFDGVLNALRVDQKEQGQIIYRTTILGQLAAENLDDIRIKYKKMAHDVWINMKERERSLEITRKKVDDVWEYAKSLVRVESDANLQIKKGRKKRDIDQELQKQINRLEDIFYSMQYSLRVRSFEELFVRLEDQMMQRERLAFLYKKQLACRDETLERKNHAELILTSLEHSVIQTTGRYQTEKRDMKRKIEEEKIREAETITMIDMRGELLMKIRASLQHISSMLLCVKVPKTIGKGKDSKKQREEEERKRSKEKALHPCLDPIENEGLDVLNQVSKKAMALQGYSNFTLDRLRSEKAKDLYEMYLAEFRSKQKFGSEEPETGMQFEHEILDTSVMTRADVKQKSKQIVEAHQAKD